MANCSFCSSLSPTPFGDSQLTNFSNDYLAFCRQALLPISLLWGKYSQKFSKLTLKSSRRDPFGEEFLFWQMIVSWPPEFYIARRRQLSRIRWLCKVLVKFEAVTQTIRILHFWECWADGFWFMIFTKHYFFLNYIFPPFYFRFFCFAPNFMAQEL